MAGSESEQQQQQMPNYNLWQMGLAFGAVLVLQIVLAQRANVDKETRRRWQHALTGQVLVAVSYVLPINFCLVLLSLGALGLALATRTTWYQETFATLLRPHELQSLPGAFYFLVGTAVVAAVYDLTEARYAVLCLSWADPMAAYVGQRFPNTPRISKNASLAGCTACFATAFILGILAFGTSNIPKALVGSLVCTVAEALPCFNDNLTIPIATATAVHLFDHNYHR